VALAGASPWAALYLRNGALVTNGDWITAGSYCLVSLVCSLLAFQILGINNTIPRYISLGDLLKITKVVLGGQLMTALVLFTFTRLDGIPRSVPTIQALVLGTGLVAYRGLVTFIESRRRHADLPPHETRESVILVGLNDWSVLVMRFLRAQAPERWRVIALLDQDTRWVGRSVNGVQIFGPPDQLETVIEEFATHGVRTDRVVVAVEVGGLSEEALAEVERVCARRDIALVFINQCFALGSVERAAQASDKGADPLPTGDFLPDILPSPYLRFKRPFDIVGAVVLILFLLPLLVVTVITVFLDVGSPVLFWQQRVGRGGRELQVYKFRTLRPPFDQKGQRVPEKQRTSRVGRLLRLTRIDELPQLANVLVGDMSLIGPRPLLPRDQPPNSAPRLTVRPGITGWAQVNGGTLLSPTEKDALDVWYIRNVSLWLDLRIIGMTFFRLVKSDRRCEEALAQARDLHCHERGSNQIDTSWSATANAQQPDNAGQHSAVQADDLTATFLPESPASLATGR
jgi:lipopolysaccharide/colanic/teichoic acid biosynthesis glycosyltransferase